MATKRNRRVTATNTNAPIRPYFMGKPIVAHDVALALAGAAFVLGVPYVMALCKSLGWW